MCGLSGSGKSTIAKELSDKYNAIIISSDSIRAELCGSVEEQSKNEEVFKIYHNRIRSLLQQRKNVIADATNITMKSRRSTLDKVNGLDVEKICYIVPKKYEECLKDNIDRPHPVPEYVIQKQMYRFQIPFMEEGWTEIVVHDSCKNVYGNNFFVENCINAMKGFNQMNPHHNMDLYNHCKKVQWLFQMYDYPIHYMLAARLHDYGKINTQVIDDDGVAHYLSHANYGSYYFLSNMCGFDHYTNRKEILDICFLINYHMMPFSWTGDKAKQKWKKRFGEYKYRMLLDFNECDKAR